MSCIAVDATRLSVFSHIDTEDATTFLYTVVGSMLVSQPKIVFMVMTRVLLMANVYCESFTPYTMKCWGYRRLGRT